MLFIQLWVYALHMFDDAFMKDDLARRNKIKYQVSPYLIPP